LQYQDFEATRSVIATPGANSRPAGDLLPRPAEPQATAEGDAAGVRPLLDLRTQLVKSSRPQLQTSGWKFTFWPGCSEASLVIVTSGSTRSRGSGDRPAQSDEAAQLHWQIANGRAGTRSRRYFVLNQLRYMWVLTFAGDGRYDRRKVMTEVSEFARRLRTLREGQTFPYWYSPELHPGGHGWHVNFFISFRVPHAEIEVLWDNGFVWVSDFASSMKGPKGEPLGLCRTPREGLRRAAHYGCKYSQKDWSLEHVGAQNHRYEVAQGFAPKKLGQWVRDPAEAEGIVGDLVPVEERRFLQHWDSNDVADWLRPPIRTWRW
jgi:hypothetical protein